MRTVCLLLFVLLPLRADRADDVVRAELEKQHIPGAAVAVLRDGRIVKMQGYGIANLELNAPVTADTVFKIGSVSKQFIAAAILLLDQDRRLDLDDRIGFYIDGVPDAWKPITIRHLLSHTSGLVRESPQFRPYTIQPDLDVVRGAFQTPLAYPIGQKWQYCNLGYFALGEIVSRAALKPWPEFLKERVFDPLGMTATRATTFRDLVPHRADSYEWREGRFVNADDYLAVRPSGALLSTLVDLAKWDAALYGDAILNSASKEKMWTPIRLNDGSTYPYGLGWQVATDKEGRRMVSHGGTLGGFKSDFVRYLNERLSIVVLTNAGQAQPGRITQSLAPLFLENAQQNRPVAR